MSKFFAIVYPNNCPVCDTNHVPLEERSIITDPNAEREYCGHCGTLMWALKRVPFRAAATIVCSLVRHGLFQVDMTSRSQQNPISLKRFDEADQVMVMCRIQYSVWGDANAKLPACRPYDRSRIPCAVPDCVRLAAELISNTSLKFDDDQTQYRPSFESADVRRDARLVRFRWVVPCSEQWFKQSYKCECVDIEFSWTAPVQGTTVIPTPDELMAAPKHARLADEELRIRADAATLLNLSVAALRQQGDGAAVSLYRTDDGQPYHQAAINQVIAELDERGWTTVIFGPGAVVQSLNFRITRKEPAKVG